MFARKVKVEVLGGDGAIPCPVRWLDSFCMRAFTGRSAFDDTLPLTDGEIEAGFRVDIDALRLDMEEWMTRKFGGGRPVRLRLSLREDQIAPAPAASAIPPDRIG